MRRISFTLGVALLLAACVRHTTSSATPQAPRATQRAAIEAGAFAWFRDTIPVLRIRPPRAYGAWRLAVEGCSGLTRTGWPRFFVAPLYPLPLDDGTVDALYVARTQTIIFALGEEAHPESVMHELLHWLTDTLVAAAPEGELAGARYERTHPREYFEVRCGALLAS